MNWESIIDIIVDEVGAIAATRIENRVRKEFGGLRVTVAKRKPITVEIIDSVAPGKPKEAAKALGVHPRTIYRVLSRDRIIR